MAQDIVPIELGLPQGDIVTLWAPRWREDGEEWEAFLGYEDALYGFPDSAHLAAFVRSPAEHDLDDHPAWHVVPNLAAVDLNPDEDHQFDLVGVPELVAEPADTFTLGELADIVEITRSLADVCELEQVHEVLDAAQGFSLLKQGTLAFSGKDGQRRWDKLREVVAERWDTVLDALDAVVTTPEVPTESLHTAQAELAEALETDEDPRQSTAEESDVDEEPDAREGSGAREGAGQDSEPGFWSQIGIDPIRVITSQGDYYSLRCYLDDEPVFLGSQRRIDVFPSTRALARFLADERATRDNDLAKVATWPSIAQKATGGELEIEVEPDNTYVLTGLADDLAEGPSEVDPNQLDLAEELLTDTASWAEDSTVSEALAPSERLGWMISFILRPDPNRLPPSPPFDAEVQAWRELVENFEQHLRTH